MTADQIAELEDRLKQAERRIAELTAERDDERALVARMREAVDTAHDMIDAWVYAFDMTQGDDGRWTWRDGLAEQFDNLAGRYNKLVRDWNKFVGQYNAQVAPRDVGRPLDASEAQCDQVRKLRRKGTSLRGIADETGLSFQTVRTILGRDKRTDRTTSKRLQRIAPDLAAEKMRAARKRTRDALPKRINESLADLKALTRDSKGR